AGTQTLPRRVGVGRALELVLTGRSVAAPEALALGLVARVVPRRRLEARTRILALRLASLPPRVALAVRRCVRAAHHLPLAAGIALERRLALGLERATP